MIAFPRQVVRIRSGLVILTAMLGCGGGDGSNIEFQADIVALPGFERDTGFLPDDSPVKVRLVARSGGGFGVRANSNVDGDKLSPIAGSGSLTMGAELAFDVFAKIDITGVKWEGQLESINYVIPAAQTNFDPFLMDSEATVTAQIPAQEILSVPLSGGPGGTVVLATEGGNLSAAFHGTCAVIHKGATEYRGAVTWSGQVLVGATLVIDVPIGDDKSFGPFTIPVDIPAFTTDLNLGIWSTDDGSEMAPDIAPCDAPPEETTGGVGTDSDGDGIPDNQNGSCGPENCDGCCNSGVCVEGDLETACGKRGETCEVCSGTRVCEQNQCTGEQGWRLKILSGDYPATDCDNASWDSGGLPDPYVEVHVSGGFKSYTSDIIENQTYAPFNFLLPAMPLEALLDQPAAITSFDSDGDDSAFMSACSFTLTEDAFDNTPEQVACLTNCAGMTSVIEYQVVPVE